MTRRGTFTTSFNHFFEPLGAKLVLAARPAERSTVKIRMLASAACAALMITAVPISAATVPSAPTPFRMFGAAGGTDVDAFYASRRGAPLWLSNGPNSPAARELISILQRSPIDGLASGPELAGRAQAMISQASGDPVRFARCRQAAVLGLGAICPGRSPTAARHDLRRRVGGSRAASRPAKSCRSRPRPRRSRLICARSRRSIPSMRNCAMPQLASGATDPRVLGTLERARALPASGRYVVVDAAGARLWMVENGSIVDSMKVIVGKPDEPDADARQRHLLCDAQALLERTAGPGPKADRPARPSAGHVLSQGPRLRGVWMAPAKPDSQSPRTKSIGKRSRTAARTVRVRQLPGRPIRWAS